MSEVSPAVNRSSFRRFLTAAVISSAGSSVTAVAMPILVVQLLDATPFEVGMVNAAQFIPYAVLGLLAGVYVDRWRRKPILVWASVGRAVALGTVPLLWLAGLLHIWVLVIAQQCSSETAIMPQVRTSLPRSIGEVTKQSSQGLLSTNKCPMQMN